MRTTSVEFRGTRATYGSIAALAVAFAPGAQAAMIEAMEETQARLLVDCIATAEPVDLYQQIERARSSVQKGSGETELIRMLSAFASDTAVVDHKALSARLAELREELKLESDHADLSPASLLAFHQFLRDTPLRAAPFVTLTNSGELYATWASGRDRLLSLRFFSPSAVAYVTFKPAVAGVVRLAWQRAVATGQRIGRAAYARMGSCVIGDPVPHEDHVSRLIKATDFDAATGRVQGSAFLLNGHGDGVSTHWIERLAQPTHKDALRLILELLKTRLKVPASRQLAVVSAGAAIDAVTAGGWPLAVLEDPLDPPPAIDSAHALAVVRPIEEHVAADQLIAELIAQAVLSVYPVANL